MKINNAQIIKLDTANQTPPDVAISTHIQNMFATYGEQKVRKALKELFGMEYKPTKKKVA